MFAVNADETKTSSLNYTDHISIYIHVCALPRSDSFENVVKIIW